MARSPLHAVRWRKAVWVAILATPLLVACVRAATGASDATPTRLRPTSPAGIGQVPGRGSMLGPTTPPVLAGSSTPTPVTPPPVVTYPSGSTGSGTTPTSGSTGSDTKPSSGSSGGGSRTPTVKKALVRNDGGRALFTLPNARPGSTSTSCVLITYNGAKAAKIRLYGKSSGTGLQQFVTLRVTRGTLPRGSAARSCSGFKADATNYRSLGKGVIYNDVLASFPNTWAKAASIGTAWKTGAKHAYRFEVQVGDDNAAQGLWMSSGFTWQARAG